MILLFLPTEVKRLLTGQRVKASIRSFCRLMRGCRSSLAQLSLAGEGIGDQSQRRRDCKRRDTTHLDRLHLPPLLHQNLQLLIHPLPPLLRLLNLKNEHLLLSVGRLGVVVRTSKGIRPCCMMLERVCAEVWTGEGD